MESKLVMVSGGFDPLHSGHLRYIYEAARLGDALLIAVNSDDFLIAKKGYYVFSQRERIAQLNLIHYPVPTRVYGISNEEDRDGSICRVLKYLTPDVFAKGGDRHPDGVPIPEVTLCDKLGIDIVYGVGGYEKPESSSIAMERAFSMWESYRGK